MASPLIRQAARRQWAALTAALLALALLLGWQNGLGRLDQTLYDAAIVAHPRASNDEVVIIAIDDESLAQIGRWPWPRAVHAALLNRLIEGRPRAIGFDLIVAEPEPGAAGDDTFAAAMRKARNVVLPVLMESGTATGLSGPRAVLPVETLAGAAAGLGHIHVEVDRDGIARSVFLREGLTSKDGKVLRWPQFALAMLEVGRGPLAESALPGARNPQPDGRQGYWSRDFWLHLPFVGAPGSFTQVPYADVLKGKVTIADFAGKYVLIGATAAGLGDAYATPVSGLARAMPGIEIHANVLDALLGRHAIVRAPAWASALAAAFVVLVAMLGLWHFSPRRGLALVAGLAAGSLLFAWLGIALFGLWIPPVATLLPLILAYPLWSWRRLESTMHFLGDQLQKLQEESSILPSALQVAVPASGDMLERSMLALETASRRLREGRRFAADTLDNLPDATAVTDNSGRILLANRAAAVCFQASDSLALRGRFIADLLGDLAVRTRGDKRVTWDMLRQLGELPENNASTETPDTALEVTARDGRAFLLHTARSTGESEKTVGWVVTLIVVSALRAAERKRDETLAFLSHDMRSPQSSIVALLELHALDPVANPIAAVHARIESYARKTLDLSEQFLQLSRAESKEYQFDVVDLAEAAKDAMDEVWAAADQKNITLTFDFDGEPVPVSADRDLLVRTVVNLLTNAIKYSAPGTTTTIAVFASEGWHTIRVTDEGYGISAEDLPHLFDRYRRFQSPGQPKATGAGLGMAFVKTVVERHRGRIDVESTPGLGTSISIFLPPATE